MNWLTVTIRALLFIRSSLLILLNDRARSAVFGRRIARWRGAGGAVTGARAHYEVRLIDDHADAAIRTITRGIHWVITERVLMAQLFRDQREGLRGILNRL